MSAKSLIHLVTACAIAMIAVPVTMTFARPMTGDTNEQQETQYQSDGISIAAASSDEAILESVSVETALEHLDQGATAWSTAQNCISCHTNGSFMAIRPELTAYTSKPSDHHRDFFVEQLVAREAADPATLVSGAQPTGIAYLALGLAQWDRHVNDGRRSAETDRAIKLMFKVQSPNGAFRNLDCWPPLESSEYHGATVAALALGAAPEWRDASHDEELTIGKEKLIGYLTETAPPHDYARVLKLWAAVEFPEIMSDAERTDIVEMIFKHQQNDGGWSMRTFAEPESWGSGNRAARIRGEEDFGAAPSDGHQTGLCILVLRKAGVPADDERIQNAIGWIKSSQRQSGRWWTRSLNTDSSHYITFSSTCYCLLALGMCGEL
ncbi:MAG: prenyltransferase/squalene oxidase repeat-containing protein [Planctomycetota bacterium]